MEAINKRINYLTWLGWILLFIVLFFRGCNAEPQFAEKIKSAKKGDLLKLDNIYFYNNSAKVVTKSEPILKPTA
jgi:hypothetical protein